MSDPEVFVLDEATSLPDSLREEWAELVWRLPNTSYFQSPEWCLAWWEHLADRPVTHVATWRSEDGRLEALAALSQMRERLHRRIPVNLGFWTNAGSGPGAADHCGFAADEPRRASVQRWVLDHRGSILVRNTGEPGPDHLSSRSRLMETVCPALALDSALEIGRSSKFRKTLRRNRRILDDRGLRFSHVVGPDITPRILERLMDLHTARSDDQGWSSTFTPERVGFHRELIADGRVGRGPGVVLAEKDDRIVGILYGFWWRSSFSYYQTGWDPEYADLSLGSVLVHEAIVNATTQGATTFDFLRGAEEYKYRFGATDRLDRTWLVPRGPTGLLLATKYGRSSD